MLGSKALVVRTGVLLMLYAIRRRQFTDQIGQIATYVLG